MRAVFYIDLCYTAHMDKKIKIGLIGLGTVGSGVFKTLQNFEDVEIVKIAVRNKNKKRNIENLDEVL